MPTNKHEKKWICVDGDCDYEIVQDECPETCPDCLERDGEDAMHWFEFVYKCPYCDEWMTPESPDEGWVECKICGLNFETEFHKDIIRGIHKHLEFYRKRTTEVGLRFRFVSYEGWFLLSVNDTPDNPSYVDTGEALTDRAACVKYAKSLGLPYKFVEEGDGNAN